MALLFKSEIPKIKQGESIINKYPYTLINVRQSRYYAIPAYNAVEGFKLLYIPSNNERIDTHSKELELDYPTILALGIASASVNQYKQANPDRVAKKNDLEILENMMPGLLSVMQQYQSVLMHPWRYA